MELAGLKTYRVILEKEFENLNTVLMLSHCGLQVMDTGEPPPPAAPPHSPCPTQSSRSSLASKTKAMGDSWPLTCSHLHSLISSLSVLSHVGSAPGLCAGCRVSGWKGVDDPKSRPWAGHLGEEETKAPALSTSQEDRPWFTRLLASGVPEGPALHGQRAWAQEGGDSLSME